MVKLYPISTTTYWTLPELLETGGMFSSSISAQTIASKIVGKTATSIPNILKLINTFFDFTNKYLTTNPIIDLKDLSRYLTLIFGNDAFNGALVGIKNMIDFPNTTKYTGKSILELLGVEFNQNQFKAGSVLASLVTWIKTPNSSLNQLFNVIKGKNQQTGIITNMIKEQMQLYENLYSKYYDLNNNQYFKLSNIKMKKYHHVNGKISTILSYQIINAIDNFTYNLTFNNDNFQKNNEFKLTSFHFQP